MYSFDVFDTLLTRRTATPEGIFCIIQEYLRARPLEFSEYLRNNFYRLRIQSELFARKIYCKGDIEDITLFQIYQTMSFMGNIEASQILKLKELEEYIEVQNVIGINENIEKVKNLIFLKKRVVAISDMYLNKEIIQKMLIKVGVPPIPIYVSSETHLCKWTGNMFRYVMQKEGIQYNKWHHLGDNIESDYKIPCRYGILAEPYLFIGLNDSDKNLLKPDNLERQLLLGSIKNLIINEQLKGYSAFGVRVVATIFYPYVRWLLDICLENEIKNLYFVHLRGDILKLLCDQIISTEHYKVETHCIKNGNQCLVREKNSFFVCITNDENTKQIMNSVLAKSTHKTIGMFCYFADNINMKDKNRCMVYTCLEEQEADLLFRLCGKDQNENQNWNLYMKGVYEFVDKLLKNSEIQKTNFDIDISVSYLKYFVSLKGNDSTENTNPFKFLLDKSIAEKRKNNEALKKLLNIPKNSKIVVYGAGNLGQYVYRRLLEKNTYRPVLWVDRWYEECTLRGLSVESPEKIKEIAFDYIFIAVVDKTKKIDIKHNLNLMNVDDSKIIWINSFDII